MRAQLDTYVAFLILSTSSLGILQALCGSSCLHVAILAQAVCTSWDVCWVPPGVLYGELDPLLRDSSRLCCDPLMGARELSQQDLARRAAPVCYAIRKARLSPSPLTRTFATASASAQVRPAAKGAPVRSRCTRPRDALRADLHRARLAAKGLRCKAAPFVPNDYIFEGPGPGWVPAKRGRMGRKALRAVHRGRENRLHALPSVPRRVFLQSSSSASITSWALSLPRQLRDTRCPLSLYIASTMVVPPLGLREGR